MRSLLTTKPDWRKQRQSAFTSLENKTGLTARFLREALPMTFHFWAKFPVDRGIAQLVALQPNWANQAQERDITETERLQK